MNWNLFSRKKGTTYAEQDNTGQWLTYLSQYATLGNDTIQTYKESNSYTLANSLAEIFIPIDAIAERESSVDYKLIYEATGKEYTPQGNLKRLIDQPNPTDRLNDLIYKASFSELSSGQSYLYTKTPKSIVNPTIDNISNLWVLDPSVTEVKLFKNIPNPFLIKDKSDLIEYYATFFLIKHEIDPRYITHRSSLGLDSNFKARVPLSSVTRNINNLLAVYHARYNVYSKNGNAGILSADKSAGGAGIEAAIQDPVTRDAIIKDIQNRNGLTGNRNFLGVSATPLKFIKTLGTIAELEPFKETEADLKTIAALFGVPKHLLPISEGTTFTNQKDAEKSLWQNVIKGRCIDRAQDLTKAFYLPDGVIFYPDFSNVEALQDDKKTSLEADTILIDNLVKLTDAGQKMENAFNNITERYNG